ncbi:MAG: hypothetical protein Q8928_19190 [Bacteroidota bacterium]|nr:hypothetical protein [Bacteroidota bacterium]
MIKNSDEKKPPIIIAISVLLSVFVGIFTSIIGIHKIVNYYNPYLFVFISGGVGLCLGIYSSIKLKPYIAVNKRMRKDYWLPPVFISTGFIGVFILGGSYLNQRLSTIDKCDRFAVIDKYRKEAHFRSPEINTLVVDINGDSQRLICNFNYWDSIAIGQQIDLCLYKSSLGFNYISVTNDDY